MEHKIFKINLQLFAQHVNVTTDTRSGNYNPTGANTLSAEMKTFYDMSLIDEAGANLIHDQFGQKRQIPKNGGTMIEFRKFSALPKAMTALTEGVVPDGKRLDVTAVTATVEQYGDFIKMSDVLELTALDNTILEATKLLGRQAGLTLDSVTRNVLMTGTNVEYCPKIAGSTETAVLSRATMDATSKLTVKVVQKVVAKLRAQNAPTFEGGKYAAIVHPYVAYDLMRDPEWVDANKYARPENLLLGEIGELAGVRFCQTTEAKVWNDSTCPANGSSAKHSVFATLFIGKGAYGVTEVEGGGLRTFVKQAGSAGAADPLEQQSSVGWKALKTAKILVPSYLVRVESCSADFGATPSN